jgi:hypothetical protein
VPTPAVALVEVLRVLAVEPLHSIRERRPRCLEHEMVVIHHQHIRMQHPPEPPHRLAEQLQEHQAIRIIAKDLLPLIPAGGDVMRQTGRIEPQLPRHTTEATSAGLPSPNTPLLVETLRQITVLGRISSTMGTLSYSLLKRHSTGVCRPRLLTRLAAALHGRAGRSHG